jgi:drug/metabolite transporter (DMT)-like permease
MLKSEIFKTPLPYIALLLAHLLWGANYVVAKIVLHEVPVMSLSFLRFGLACLLISPFLINLEPKMKKVQYAHIPRLIIASLLLGTINITFFYLGISKTLAINASVLNLIVPILSVLGAWWFLKEKIYSINLIGIILAVLGTAAVIGLPLLLTSNFSGVEMFGNLLLILGGISFVAGALIIKPMFKEYSPLSITAFTFLTATVAFFIPALLEYIANPDWISQVGIVSMLGILYIAVLSTVVAYFLMMWSYSKIELSHAVIIQYVEPAVAASLAIPLLGERISYSFIVGFCMIALGVYWGTLGRTEHHHINHKHQRS